ncbi:MAG: lipoate--protein ligase family protein [Spirochaetaceae bacterium]|nr:lipoate--protein ligase family protein [Spirochaetaceae bacterium]
MKLRFLETGAGTGAFNMGLDEALLESVAAGRSAPVLRLYRWEPAAVTIGYFQSMEAEVDLEACRAAGVDALRRSTGGGAVFHAAEITYSVVAPEGHPLAPADILESYRRVAGGIVEGLALLGVEAAFAPINDITAAGRKVSGNAQTRKLGCLLQHGTLLLDVDPERMFSLLRVPNEKLKGKLIEDVKARVAGLKGLLGREVGYGEAAEALRRGFAASFGRLEGGGGATLEASAPTGPELERAAALAAEKYSSPAWNLKR